jgi:hypothetical protein
MTSNEITQKLALLPEGVEEENLRTWKETIDYYQEALQVDPEMISAEAISIHKHLLNLVQTISKSGQEKLYRAYSSLSMLIISTTTPTAKDYGDLFIVVDVKTDNLAYVAYSGRKEVIEFTECKINEIMPTLQPLLDRLWNETRGKKKA